MATRLRQTRFEKVLPLIKEVFERSAPRIYRYKDLVQLLGENRNSWRLPGSITDQIRTLLESSGLRQIFFEPIHYPEAAIETRYVYGSLNPLLGALSLKAGSYLSHASAMFLHNLTQQLPRQIFVNKEQSLKPRSEGALSQAGIDRAFRAPKHRQSQYVFKFEENEMTLLSGKNTGRLAVESLQLGEGISVDATNLERTLIDIVVRPGYAGGVTQVLTAFAAARDQVSVGTLIAVLKQMDYHYPYHQAIGFYMQQAGFRENQYGRLKAMEQDVDFYLTYGMKDTEYVPYWKLFVPRGLMSLST